MCGGDAMRHCEGNAPHGKISSAFGGAASDFGKQPLRWQVRRTIELLNAAIGPGASAAGERWLRFAAAVRGAI
jgi:hypothetical protein